MSADSVPPGLSMSVVAFGNCTIDSCDTRLVDLIGTRHLRLVISMLQSLSGSLRKKSIQTWRPLLPNLGGLVCKISGRHRTCMARLRAEGCLWVEFEETQG